MSYPISSSLLDGIVLAVVERESTYGYRITQDVQKVLDISESTLYPVLRRLMKDGCLTIQAVKGLDKDASDKEGKYIRQERYAGACSRSFYVGDAVEPEDVSAKFEDGIPTISVPKNVKKQLPKNSAISIQ